MYKRQVEDYAVYMCPTGATVEEISVFRTSDAAAVEEMIQTHLDARKTEYESYRPDEVKKLDGAAVVKSGDYCLLYTSYAIVGYGVVSYDNRTFTPITYGAVTTEARCV